MEHTPGTFVVVRAFGDEALVRRLWSENDSVVWIYDDEQFVRRTEGKPTCEPMGFPIEDVYVFNPQKDSLTALHEPNWWEKLRPWINRRPLIGAR